MATKDEISFKRKQLEDQLAKLEAEEKNFDKKAEGFKKLEELKDKFEADKLKIATQFFINEDELKAFFGPKILIRFGYTKLGEPKTYEWHKGKIGKAPTEWEAIKIMGSDEVRKYLTEDGKAWFATDEGKEEFKTYMTPAKKK
jgi:hypothetical protein